MVLSLGGVLLYVCVYVCVCKCVVYECVTSWYSTHHRESWCLGGVMPVCVSVCIFVRSLDWRRRGGGGVGLGGKAKVFLWICACIYVM